MGWEERNVPTPHICVSRFFREREKSKIWPIRKWGGEGILNPYGTINLIRDVAPRHCCKPPSA